MNVLYLSPRLPWPPRSGAKLRDYHFARCLGRETALTYAYFSPDGERTLTQKEMPFCREILAVEKPASYGLRTVLAGLFGTTPLPVLNYRSARMTAALADVLTRSAVDVIHVDSPHMYQYAVNRGTLPDRIVVCNWHNIESEAMARYASTVNSVARRWYAQVTADKLRRLERQMLRDADGHIVCSEREREQLLRLVPDARIHVAENGVDTAFFQPRAGQLPTAVRLVLVGTMDYFPNVDAAQLFVREIWPHVRRAFPEAILTIVGANPLPAVKELARTAGVSVTGTVDDVRPFYQDALAAVVPIRTGGGTRLKILEAMSTGTAVISTEVGAEGLAVTSEQDILFASQADPASWVRQIAALCEQPERRSALLKNARALVVERYSWDRIGDALVDRYSAWAADATRGRRAG